MTAALPELVLFGREPSAGKVKTRLGAGLGPEEAAMLYAAFLEDLSAGLRSPAEWRAVLAHDGEAGPFLKGRFGAGWALRPQGDGPLGDRLARAFEESAARGSLAAAVAGSDAPLLDAGDVRRAFDAVLAGPAGMALAPSPDGGFALVALGAGVSPDFLRRPIRWSTEHALADLLEASGAAGGAAAGPSVTLLPPVADVDRLEDLAPLRKALAADAGRAPATARLLAALPGPLGAGADGAGRGV